MEKIVIFDPSIFSRNLGDDIIVEFCYEEVSALLPNMIQVRLPTQQSPSLASIKYARASKYKFVFGTNLLSSNILTHQQWKCDLNKINILQGVILMGVGWWQYQSNPTFLTSKYYNHILNHEIIHSVRDSYTENKLAAIGLGNVINTGCPTTWNLTEEFCATIPTVRSRNALIAFTDYKPDPHNDIQLLDFLCREYEVVYFWPQGYADYVYINELLVRGRYKLKFVGASLFQLRKFMENTDFDYIGTRLHAGIMSLNYRKRALIVAVDNRASEMRADINLPVVDRGDMLNIKNFVINRHLTRLHIKKENINLWRNQFRQENKFVI